MAAERIILLPNGLYFDPLMTAIRGAKRRIQIAMYLFKTTYANHTRANDVADALLEAVNLRGVSVEVVLDNGRWDSKVCAANWATAQLLAAGGVQVRMGPSDESWHQKIVLVDEFMAFVGSHNITRGGLTDNCELSVRTDLKSVVDPVKRILRDRWAQAYPLDVATPAPVIGPPLEFAILSTSCEGDRLILNFEAEHTENVEAFAAVADTTSRLEGARMGPTVPPTERTAYVRSPVEPGQWVHVAVRAYAAGETLATSGVVGFIYEGSPLPPGSEPKPEGGAEEGGAETPPSGLPAPPNLYEVQRASDTTVRLRWAFGGLANFRRFVIEQQDMSGDWQHVATLRESSAREWTGAPLAMDSPLPFRVVVFNTEEESTASEERAMG